MGCEVLRTPSAPPEVQRFEILVALMLSSQVCGPAQKGRCGLRSQLLTTRAWSGDTM